MLEQNRTKKMLFVMLMIILIMSSLLTIAAFVMPQPVLAYNESVDGTPIQRRLCPYEETRKVEYECYSCYYPPLPRYKVEYQSRVVDPCTGYVGEWTTYATNCIVCGL